ncbi:Ankyrin repeat [Nesidiocoris tenuis]|uniref:Ankyrin repeat n=1 Tax=Nesidiocoris tenuis TaxID=355587 RepID=A0ABN7AP61_9HEMI|nr:Ankyrin repeat [Nesidiocoris tenuis]
MGSRPAGATSDEDSEDEYYWGERPPKSPRYVQQIKPVELSPNENLITACENDEVESARKAILDGANVHYRSKTFGNYTPIMLAANRGNLEILKLLLDKGANVKDNFEMFNVLMCLCSSRSKDEERLLECLDTLLDHGADPHSKDWVGATPLHGAVRFNHPLLVKRLLTVESSIEVEDGDGWTPIFYAVNSKNFAMVKQLFDAGANIAAIDRRGNSLTDVAAQAGASGDEDLAKLLSPQDESLLASTEIEVQNACPSSSYRLAMQNAPRLDDRMYGFHSDALRIINGMGVASVGRIMEQKKIQLAELMTWNEEEWRMAGVEISYHIRKIRYSVIKYHEQEWGKGAIPSFGKIFCADELDLFETVRLLLDCVRIFHILSITTHLTAESLSPTDLLAPELRKEIAEIRAWTSVAKKQLSIMKMLNQSIQENSCTPPDLIGEPRPKKSNRIKYAVFGCFFFLSVLKFRSGPLNLLGVWRYVPVKLPILRGL